MTFLLLNLQGARRMLTRARAGPLSRKSANGDTVPCLITEKMVNLQRFLYPRGWDVRLVRGVYAELLGTLLLSFIFNLTAVNSTNNAALAAGASYAVLGAALHLQESKQLTWLGSRAA